MLDLDLGTIAQLATAVVACGFALIKAIVALVNAFKPKGN